MPRMRSRAQELREDTGFWLMIFRMKISNYMQHRTKVLRRTHEARDIMLRGGPSDPSAPATQAARVAQALRSRQVVLAQQGGKQVLGFYLVIPVMLPDDMPIESLRSSLASRDEQSSRSRQPILKKPAAVKKGVSSRVLKKPAAVAKGSKKSSSSARAAPASKPPSLLERIQAASARHQARLAAEQCLQARGSSNSSSSHCT